MSNARDFMKQAHANKDNTPQTVTSPLVEKKAPALVIPKSQPVVKRKQPVAKENITDIPTAVRQIARDDVPITMYGINPVQTPFQTYNRELFEWLRNFSSANQFNGGVAISKSQAIEIMLDVMMYDLGINPIGYESQQALRKDIQNKIKGIE
jgi:hypothetical protein